jgi:hypothetical protein
MSLDEDVRQGSVSSAQRRFLLPVVVMLTERGGGRVESLEGNQCYNLRKALASMLYLNVLYGYDLALCLFSTTHAHPFLDVTPPFTATSVKVFTRV